MPEHVAFDVPKPGASSREPDRRLDESMRERAAVLLTEDALAPQVPVRAEWCYPRATDGGSAGKRRGREAISAVLLSDGPPRRKLSPCTTESAGSRARQMPAIGSVRRWSLRTYFPPTAPSSGCYR